MLNLQSIVELEGHMHAYCIVDFCCFYGNFIYFCTKLTK